MNKDKQDIINRFNQHVKGKKSDTTQSNQKHDGKEGHWLETQMGIRHNGDNAPDLFGYEMKNQTTSGKITFGDWSADEYIFIPNKRINDTNKTFQFSRNNFLDIFGKLNQKKGNRPSWSGEPCPTYYEDMTIFGQS